jgi:hypothetical protein
LGSSNLLNPHFGTLVSSTNKADRHDITEILLKVALNTIIYNARETKRWVCCSSSWTLVSASLAFAKLSFVNLARSNVNVAYVEERSYTDSTTNSNIDRDLDFDSTVTSNINGYAWCINKTACVFWATISKNKAKLYKALAEKSLASAQQYLDSSGSEKQAFANQEADKLDSESNNAENA